jgi:Transcription elongation factor, GreA/GreB, C-term
MEDFKKIGKVQVGSHVRVDLVYETETEQLEFDIVADQHADFTHGLLGESTPLAQVLIGKTAGQVVSYKIGDAQMVRILDVSPGKQADLENISARRQETMRKALEETERTNAMIFASSYSGKWGDYDPSGIEAWEKKDAQNAQDEEEGESA